LDMIQSCRQFVLKDVLSRFFRSQILHDP